MRRSALLALLLATAACTPDWPMDRAGSWRVGETGANDANLRAMIVNPRELEVGTADPATVGAEAAPPVRRLLTGRRYPLPSTSSLQVILGNGPQQPAPGDQNAGQ